MNEALEEKLAAVPPPGRYGEALEGRAVLPTFEEAPRRVADRVTHLNDELVRRRPAPGKWSVHEIVGHLADHEVILGARLRLTAGLDRPPIQGYDQDAMVARLGLENATTAELLDAFRAGRELTLGFLRRLPISGWDRIGLHTERGEESVAAMVALYAAHDLIHEAQLDRTLARLA